MRTATALATGLAAAAVAGAGTWYWIGRQTGAGPAPQVAPPAAPGPAIVLPDLAPPASDLQSPFRFVSVAEQSGIDFTYYGAPSPAQYMTEQNGGGVALFDFDGDGRLDVFLSNGSHFDRPAELENASSRLFRAVGEMRYEDVTLQAGLESYGIGMGAAAGDYDNDGFTDLFVCYYGKNRLWHNNGDGTFTDVTDEAGVGDTRWASSAAIADLDRDGHLDLYVVNYVVYGKNDAPCFSESDPPIRITCGPIGRPGQPDVLYRNLGDGRFEDVSRKAGIDPSDRGKGLGVVIVDLDEDGLLDIYVANDTTENFLYHNLGQMRFEEVGLAWGVAYSADGAAQSGMGTGCTDFNGDGHFDLFVTNFEGQVNDFYQNLGGGRFQARNSALGLDTTSRPMLSFGTVFADFDLDQWPDLFITSGHIWDLSSLGTDHQYHMTPQIFRNLGGKRYVDVSRQTGDDYFRRKWLGRAAAVGDLDNDGDPDLVVGHLEKPSAVLRNESRRAGRSMRLKFIGVGSARQPLGARVEAVLGERRLVGCVPSGGSFQASNDERVLLAVGEAGKLDELRIHWPNGKAEMWRDVPIQPELTVTEGTGQPLKPLTSE